MNKAIYDFVETTAKNWHKIETSHCTKCGEVVLGDLDGICARCI